MQNEILSIEREFDMDSEDVTNIYTNNVSVQMSVYDIILSLSVTEPTIDKQIKTRLLANIIMSPQHVKALLIVLQEQIETYEKEFGTIPTEKPVHIHGCPKSEI